ncbi:IQ calmodulin-binding domain containing protein igloo [Arctopsyche grandis]|uniref:IQ calmodulin-binding domain containing protein igloo n=1 Tax=Arctopsyche grandis TaxID=121162 RepID=UPI00406D8CDE
MSDNKQEPDPTKEELEAEFDPEDKELCHAATKIQASFRGHQVRKQAEQVAAKEVEELSAKAEELDIDLTDPELNKAATKIQASFRGHKANARH